jgi:hypothetical protein
MGLVSAGVDALTAPENPQAADTPAPSRLRSAGQKLGIVGNILGIYNEYMSSGSIGQTAGATLNGMLSNTLGLGASALDLGGAAAGADDYSNFTNFLILPGRLTGALAEDLITGSSFIDGVLTQYGQIGPSLPFFEVGQNIGDALGLPGLIQPDVVGEMINTTTLQANDGSRSAQSGNVVPLNPVPQETDAESDSCAPPGGSFVPYDYSYGDFEDVLLPPTSREASRDKRPGIMNELPLKLVIC